LTDDILKLVFSQSFDEIYDGIYAVLGCWFGLKKIFAEQIYDIGRRQYDDAG
jgi:hypothetical protein